MRCHAIMLAAASVVGALALADDPRPSLSEPGQNFSDAAQRAPAVAAPSGSGTMAAAAATAAPGAPGTAAPGAPGTAAPSAPGTAAPSAPGTAAPSAPG